MRNFLKNKQEVAHKISEEKSKVLNLHEFYNSRTYKISLQAQPYSPKFYEKRKKVVVTIPHTSDKYD